MASETNQRVKDRAMVLDAVRHSDWTSATHYVWGWQDREGQADSTIAHRFADVWVAYRLAYGAEVIWHMMPMVKTWREFESTGMVRIDNTSGGWVIVPDGLSASILPVPNVKEY